MGYSTDFDGQFDLDKPLQPEHAAYLKKFSETRRMKRDARKAAKLDDPVRDAADLPIGNEAQYFVGGAGFAGQDRDDSILDYNNPAPPQPGLWCQWEPNDNNDGIIWNGAEKFYNYVEWLSYIIRHFLKPWGYKLNGEVRWRGEDFEDIGVIVVENNKVSVRRAMW